MSVTTVCHGLGGTSVCIRGALARVGSWHIVHDLVISPMFLFRFLQNTDVRALSLVFSVPWWLSCSLDISLEGLWDNNSVALKEVVYNSWPITVRELPSLIGPCWTYREELSIEDSLIFVFDGQFFTVSPIGSYQ